MTEHPRQFEIVTRGVREGTFLHRNGPVQYSILWTDNQAPEWVPAVGIMRTGRLNHALIEEFSKHISSRVKIRRKGGLQKGPRYAVGSPGGSVQQGRAAQPGDPRNLHKPVKDEPKEKRLEGST